jgi:hypothetical protein
LEILKPWKRFGSEKEKISQGKKEVSIWEKEAKEIMEGNNEKGFKKGNKLILLRKVYDGKENNEEISKQELRSDPEVKFISHNINMEKW